MDDVLTELRLLGDNNERYFGAMRHYQAENARQHQELWNDLAELRDGLLALANRLEALTQVVTTEVSDAV